MSTGKEIAAIYCESPGCGRLGHHDDCSLSKAIDAALAAENEACAKIVEEYLPPQSCDVNDMENLAADIRARRRP